MADEPENVDLNFIAAQLGKVLEGQREMRGQIAEMQAGQREMNERLGKLEVSVSELQIAVAATRVDMAAVKASVAEIAETQRNHGARLNAMDGRLALIEKHAGMVNA